MKKISSLYLVLFLLSAFSISAQKEMNNNLYTKNGTVVLEANLETFISGFNIQNEAVYSEVFYKLIQFNAIPDNKSQKELKALGVELLEYIPNNTYLSSFNKNTDISKLKHFNIQSIGNIDATFKLHPDLFNKTYPAHALFGTDKIELNVSRYEKISTNDVVQNLLENSVEVLEFYPESRNIRLITSIHQIPFLTALPFISYLEPVAPPAEPEDTRGRSLHRSNAINTIYAAGRKYDGTGVKVAVNDDGFVGPHIDFTGRIDNSEVATDFAGTHGDGVAGIVGSAGNLNPNNTGMAPGVFQKIRQYSSSLPNTVTLHTTEQIMMFNSSYSNGVNAGYTSVTQLIDGEIFNNPSLIQIFSAGNSNGSGSTPAGSQWFNITGGHKSGKNVIATANLYYDDLLVSSSSRGPATDGRLKPDIASNGQNQISNSPNNTYQSFGGTSGAAPGIMGCAAQLYHAYKDLNAGVNPPSALIKASMMNTSHDLGNVGPDFKYGWGRINALRALRLIEDNRYFTDTVSQSGVNNHNIVIPASIAELRVMVYWVDPAASTSAQQALVNDLDITLMDPSTTSHLPLILDPTPNATTLDLPAVPGVDTLNNVEQVRITSPSAGTYTLNVTGTTVPFGPQEYFVVYEFIKDEIEVIYPIGEEGFVPGETEALRWDAHGNTGNFTIEYSTDNGTSWNVITTSVGAAIRYYNWTVPSVLTGDALIRVSRGAATDVSDETFNIIGVPSGLAVDFACPDSARLIWNAVTGATSYEVSKLGAMYMDSVGTSATTSFIVTGLNPVDEFWFSVKARGPGIVGRRAIAINKAPGTFACPIPIDGAAVSFVSPGGGVLMDCHNTSAVPVTVTIENKGLTAISNFDISYRFNGGVITTETITGTVNPLAQLNHTFAATVDLSIAGAYNFEAWTTVSSDGNVFNDSISSVVTVVVASGIQTLPFTEDFESFLNCATSTNCGLTICPLINGFINLSNGLDDDIDWRTDVGGTSSSGTGPTTDHNPGTAGGKYLYTEASGSPVCALKTALMISPCIDLNGKYGPELRFWYHMTGTSMGSLHVDIFDGTTWINDVMTPISGDQGSAWIQAIIDLSSYTGQIINFRIRGITGTSWSSDIAIDDIIVEDLCVGNNLRTWTGAIDNNWDNAGNWVCGVPSTTKDVIIPNGTIPCIIYSGQSGICNTVTVENGASLIIQPTGKLEVAQ